MRAALLCSIALCASAAVAGADPSSTLVVVLDPGHGGPPPREGAHGPDGLVEKDIALAVALKTKALLEAAGATVLMTRESDVDVPFAARARVANEASADLFLSIHCNSMQTRASRRKTRGVETYFLSPDPTDAEARLVAQLENGGPDAVLLPKSADPVSGILADLALGQARNDSAALAELILRHVTRTTKAPSRGVRQAPFVVLSGVKMPAVLAEIGFISHPEEGRMLSHEKYQERIATALAAAVREYGQKVLAKRLVLDRGAAPGSAGKPDVTAAGVVAPGPATR